MLLGMCNSATTMESSIESPQKPKNINTIQSSDTTYRHIIYLKEYKSE
jgi:hypothetical protein